MTEELLSKLACIVEAWHPPRDVSVTIDLRRKDPRSLRVVLRSAAGDEAELYLPDLEEASIERILAVGVKSLRTLAYERTLGRAFALPIEERWN